MPIPVPITAALLKNVQESGEIIFLTGRSIKYKNISLTNTGS
jgi:hypothetical protein